MERRLLLAPTITATASGLRSEANRSYVAGTFMCRSVTNLNFSGIIIQPNNETHGNSTEEQNTSHRRNSRPASAALPRCRTGEVRLHARTPRPVNSPDRATHTKRRSPEESLHRKTRINPDQLDHSFPTSIEVNDLLHPSPAKVWPVFSLECYCPIDQVNAPPLLEDSHNLCPVLAGRDNNQSPNLPPI